MAFRHIRVLYITLVIINKDNSRTIRGVGVHGPTKPRLARSTYMSRAQLTSRMETQVWHLVLNMAVMLCLLYQGSNSGIQDELAKFSRCLVLSLNGLDPSRSPRPCPALIPSPNVISWIASISRRTTGHPRWAIPSCSCSATLAQRICT